MLPAGTPHVQSQHATRQLRAATPRRLAGASPAAPKAQRSLSRARTASAGGSRGRCPGTESPNATSHRGTPCTANVLATPTTANQREAERARTRLVGAAWRVLPAHSDASLRAARREGAITPRPRQATGSSPQSAGDHHLLHLVGPLADREDLGV